jgi:hypothetical protein
MKTAMISWKFERISMGKGRFEESEAVFVLSSLEVWDKVEVQVEF